MTILLAENNFHYCRFKVSLKINGMIFVLQLKEEDDSISMTESRSWELCCPNKTRKLLFLKSIYTAML